MYKKSPDAIHGDKRRTISTVTGDPSEISRDEKCQLSFQKCFMYTLQGFFSGSEQTEGKQKIFLNQIGFFLNSVQNTY